MAAPTREAAAVFADALLEAGDPWGEFIARSLRGEHEAARSLRATHEKTWLAGLRSYLSELDYRDGLLFGASLSRRAPQAKQRIASAIEHPMLVTVRRLVREKSKVKGTNATPFTAYRAFVLSERMRALQEIDGSDLKLLRELSQRGGLGITSLLDLPFERATASVLAQPGLARVRSLEFKLPGDACAAALDELRRMPAAEGREVRMSFTTSESGPNDLLAIDAWPTLRVATLRVWDLTLTRTAYGTTARWDARGADYRLEKGLDPFHGGRLAAAVKDLKRVVFSGPAAPLDVAVAFAQRALPRVSFENADGSPVSTRKRPKVEQPETLSDHFVSFLDRIWGPR
jgi:hypothetical protein